MTTKDMEYAILLLIFADKVRCDDAIEICLLSIPEKLEIHDKYIYSNNNYTESWKLLMKKNTLSVQTKVNLSGLMLKRKFYEYSGQTNDEYRRRIDVDINAIANELINFKV